MDRRAYFRIIVSSVIGVLAGCTSPFRDDPETIVGRYYDAVADGDQETVDTLYYDGLPAPSIDEDGQEVTVESIERASVRDVVERDGRNRNESEVDAAVGQARRNIEGQAAQIGADDYVIVLAAVKIDGQDRRVPFVLVEIDGRWRILQ